MKQLFLFFIFSLPVVAHSEPDFFGEYNGAFVLLNSKTKVIQRVNERLAKTRLAPCSTFKVPNTVFGLETNYISGKDFTLRFDPQKARLSSNAPKSWARNHNLESAIRNSVVWYYQDVARNIGAKKMQEMLNKANFGNHDISGGIDKFWLSSSLKISPEEQVKFWDKLFSYKLSFKKQNVDVVKEIIVEEQNDSYTLRAKTGTCFLGKGKHGAWWVGSVEKSESIHYFSIYLEGDSFKKVSSDRREIGRKFLQKFGVL